MKWECVEYGDEHHTTLVEVIPTEGHRPHEACWCRPEQMQSCVECEDSNDPDCWRCGGRGLVPFDRWSGEIPIVVHHDPRLPPSYSNNWKPA